MNEKTLVETLSEWAESAQELITWLPARIAKEGDRQIFALRARVTELETTTGEEIIRLNARLAELETDKRHSESLTTSLKVTKASLDKAKSLLRETLPCFGEAWARHVRKFLADATAAQPAPSEPAFNCPPLAQKMTAPFVPAERREQEGESHGKATPESVPAYVNTDVETIVAEGEEVQPRAMATDREAVSHAGVAQPPNAVEVTIDALGTVDAGPGDFYPFSKAKQLAVADIIANIDRVSKPLRERIAELSKERDELRARWEASRSANTEQSVPAAPETTTPDAGEVTTYFLDNLRGFEPFADSGGDDGASMQLSPDGTYLHWEEARGAAIGDIRANVERVAGPLRGNSAELERLLRKAMDDAKAWEIASCNNGAAKDKAERECDSLRERIAELRHELDGHANQEASWKELLDSVKRERDDLRARWEASRAANTELRARLKNAWTVRDEARAELARLRSQPGPKPSDEEVVANALDELRVHANEMAEACRYAKDKGGAEMCNYFEQWALARLRHPIMMIRLEDGKHTPEYQRQCRSRKGRTETKA